MSSSLSFSQIEAAAQRIQGGVKRTPCRYAHRLSDHLGLDIYIKFENRQFTHAFKERGALNKILQLSDEEKEKGVIAASAGNHAQAVALHATRLNIPSHIFMPKGTPFNKIKKTKSLGAKVTLIGTSFDESKTAALEESRLKNIPFIDPFDDFEVIAGQGTIAIEMLEDFPKLDVLLIPVGGGGLISGMAIAAKALKPDIQIIGIQTEAFPYLKKLISGDPIPDIGLSRSIAEGISVKKPGKLTTEIIREKVDQMALVNERSIEEAINLLLDEEKVLSEGAGAVGLAYLMKNPEQFKGKAIGLPISGGNIDMRLLATSLMRGLIRSHRIIALEILLDDSPGGLALSAQTIAEAGGNVIEVQHQRQFGDVSGNQVKLSITVEAQDENHGKEIVFALKNKGVTVSKTTPH